MHTRMLFIGDANVEPMTSLVQSTDAAWHHAWETAVALILATGR